MSKPKGQEKRRKKRVFYLSIGLVTLGAFLLWGYIGVQIILSFIANMGFTILPELGAWAETVALLVAEIVVTFIFLVSLFWSEKKK